jgi:hypothetical protein
MTRLDVTVVVQGPLFKNGKGELDNAMQQAVRDVVSFGEERLNEKLRPRPTGVFLSVAEARKGQASVGDYRRRVGENVRVSGMSGSISDGGMIYGPWLEGLSQRNQSTRFKGYFTFRKTGQDMQKEAPKILSKNIKRFIKKVG